MNKDLHILVLPSWYPNTYNKLSGVFFKEQAEALAKNNIKIGVIALNEINLKQIIVNKKFDFFYSNKIINNVNLYQIQYPILPKLQFIRRKMRKYIFKQIFNKYIKEQGKPDIVHLHSFLYGDLALYLKEKYNIPYIVTEHHTGLVRDIFSKKNLELASQVFNCSSSNIAVSNEFKKILENKFYKSFIYVPNIVNTNYFSPNFFIKREKEKFRFINIAFLDKKKNQDMLIRAFHKSFYKKNVELIIVGDGPEYNNLKNLIEELDLEKQVTLYGRASRKEVKNLLTQSDVFVLSSKFETFGVVLIEALAMGLPVVSTKCGGPESIITNDKIGYLCNINEEDLSDKMMKIYYNYKNFNKTYLVNYIKDNFSETAVINKLLNIYKEVIK